VLLLWMTTLYMYHSLIFYSDENFIRG
jgi:hypothetical protein